MLRQTFITVSLALMVLIVPVTGLGQSSLLQDSWQLVESEYFTVYSQVSGNRTERFVRDLETWRKAASAVITNGGNLPSSAVDNLVFLFDDLSNFQAFALADESAFFYPTPRRNFMAVVFGDDTSLAQARHHYVHFLMRNFTDLRIPRWYEEGLAGYLSNFTVGRNRVELESYSQRAFEASLAVNPEISLQELIYDESALASPRRIQIANLKSELFLHFLLHGHEESGFTDRREQLGQYIKLSVAGRSQRFAYDQSFDISIGQLDTEYERYLRESRRPEGQLEIADLENTASYQSSDADFFVIANALGELAINAGKFELAENFYRGAIEQDSPLPRSYSGLADSLRMQEEISVTDAVLTGYYEKALNLGPQQPEILLDYGEYLASVLEDCDRVLSPGQITSIEDEIEYYFSKVISLVPDNPEANLAMGQYYLFDSQDVRQGVAYQSKALELLSADSFIMEQTIQYKIEAGDYQEAERLINELSQPLHFWVEPGWVSNLRRQMQHKQQGVGFDVCEHGV